jgi:hypothetical protein
MMKRLRLYKPLALLLALCLLCGCQSAAGTSANSTPASSSSAPAEAASNNAGSTADPSAAVSSTDPEIDGSYNVAWIGDLIDGTYYYLVSGDGLYAYRPGETPVKRLEATEFDNYWVTDYALYYTLLNEKNIYIQPHSTQQSDPLYAIQDEDCDSFSAETTEDGNLLLTIYTGEDAEEPEDHLLYQLLVDGTTGADLGTVTEPITEAEFTTQADPATSSELPNYHWIGDAGDVLFYLDNGVSCYDPATKEQWALTLDSDLEMGSAVTDGTYLYSVRGEEMEDYSLDVDPASYQDVSKQTLWKVVYDEDGLPTALTLVEEDITALS